VKKFCANCAREHEERGWFCGIECRKQFRNRKRSERAGEVCRLCGRRRPKPKQVDAVLSEHKAIQESSVCPM
jgi:hypothetical protein